MQLGIDLGRAGNNRYGITLAAIQPGALNGDRTFRHIKRLQLTAGVEHRFPRGERRIRRVDKSAAVTGDTVGVRHNNVGRLSRHFGVAL